MASADGAPVPVEGSGASTGAAGGKTTVAEQMPSDAAPSPAAVSGDGGPKPAVASTDAVAPALASVHVAAPAQSSDDGVQPTGSASSTPAAAVAEVPARDAIPAVAPDSDAAVAAMPGPPPVPAKPSIDAAPTPAALSGDAASTSAKGSSATPVLPAASEDAGPMPAEVPSAAAALGGNSDAIPVPGVSGDANSGPGTLSDAADIIEVRDGAAASALVSAPCADADPAVHVGSSSIHDLDEDCRAAAAITMPSPEPRSEGATWQGPKVECGSATSAGPDGSAPDLRTEAASAHTCPSLAMPAEAPGALARAGAHSAPTSTPTESVRRPCTIQVDSGAQPRRGSTSKAGEGVQKATIAGEEARPGMPEGAGCKLASASRTSSSPRAVLETAGHSITRRDTLSQPPSASVIGRDLVGLATGVSTAEGASAAREQSKSLTNQQVLDSSTPTLVPPVQMHQTLGPPLQEELQRREKILQEQFARQLEEALQETRLQHEDEQRALAEQVRELQQVQKDLCKHQQQQQPEAKPTAQPQSQSQSQPQPHPEPQPQLLQPLAQSHLQSQLQPQPRLQMQMQPQPQPQPQPHLQLQQILLHQHQHHVASQGFLPTVALEEAKAQHVAQLLTPRFPSPRPLQEHGSQPPNGTALHNSGMSAMQQPRGQPAWAGASGPDARGFSTIAPSVPEPCEIQGTFGTPTPHRVHTAHGTLGTPSRAHVPQSASHVDSGHDVHNSTYTTSGADVETSFCSDTAETTPDSAGSMRQPPSRCTAAVQLGLAGPGDPKHLRASVHPEGQPALSHLPYYGERAADPQLQSLQQRLEDEVSSVLGLPSCHDTTRVAERG